MSIRSSKQAKQVSLQELPFFFLSFFSRSIRIALHHTPAFLPPPANRILDRASKSQKAKWASSNSTSGPWAGWLAELGKATCPTNQEAAEGWLVGFFFFFPSLPLPAPEGHPSILPVILILGASGQRIKSASNQPQIRASNCQPKEKKKKGKKKKRKRRHGKKKIFSFFPFLSFPLALGKSGNRRASLEQVPAARTLLKSPQCAVRLQDYRGPVKISQYRPGSTVLRHGFGQFSIRPGLGLPPPLQLSVARSNNNNNRKEK